MQREPGPIAVTGGVNDLIKGMANCDGCGSRWDNKQTAPVGTFNPNPFGLYDTAGNVFEWVQDCWHENYKGAPTDGPAREQKDGGDCGRRGLRGGWWGHAHNDMRSSFRNRNRPDSRLRALGFRLVREIEKGE